MAWDGYKYPHLSAGARQPYWVLGKGLFYRVSDLIALGGFHPWITIEDPEIGLRYWANGKRLGILSSPLIEEVPRTWLQGVTQRKRWICGFFQTLGRPLSYLGLSPWQRFKCWLIFFPCLSLWINVIGLPLGVWAAWMYFRPSARSPGLDLLVRRHQPHAIRVFAYPPVHQHLAPDSACLPALRLTACGI